MTPASPHVLVLAAGDGTRLAPLTTDADGRVVPKQFFDFGDGSSLLRKTIRRARGLAPDERILAVVAEGHRRWWTRDLRGVHPANVVVQPENRGTAPGILLPLLHLYYRDPDALVVILPSDHHVSRERVLRRALLDAVRAADEDRSRVFLLGMTPDAPESDYGWILASPGDGVARVAAFVEKPEPARAAELHGRGALWSSFMMAGHVRAFLRLFATELPGTWRSMLTAVSHGGAERPTMRLRHLYRDLPPSDFSRDVLEPGRESLAVLTVPECGWSDLGTPARVSAWRRQRDLAAPALPSLLTAASA